MKKIFYFVLLAPLIGGCCKTDKGRFSTIAATPMSVEVSDGTSVITYGVDLKKEVIFYPISILLPDSTLILL